MLRPPGPAIRQRPMAVHEGIGGLPGQQPSVAGGQTSETIIPVGIDLGVKNHQVGAHRVKPVGQHGHHRRRDPSGVTGSTTRCQIPPTFWATAPQSSPA